MLRQRLELATSDRLYILQFWFTPQCRRLEIFNSDHVEVEKATVKINRSLENQASAFNNDLNLLVGQITKTSVFNTSVGLSHHVFLMSSHECNYIHPRTCLHQYISSKLVDIIWLISIYINAFIISCPWTQDVERAYARCSEDIQYTF